MELLLKLSAFIGVGAIILALNVWYLRTAYESFSGRGIVIAPINVLGAQDKFIGLDENLSRLLLSSIGSIEWSLEQSQTELQRPLDQLVVAETAAPATLSPSIGIVDILGPNRRAGLEVRLFEPSKIVATVGGVDVGGLLPRVQRWFVQDRILSLSASFTEADTVIVSGDVRLLGSGDTRPLRLKINQATPEVIAEDIAYELVRRSMSSENAFYAQLQHEEFKVLVNAVGRIAEINQRVERYGIAASGQYTEVLNELAPLADALPTWPELNRFAGSVAEAAQEFPKALALFERAVTIRSDRALEERIAALQTFLEPQTADPTALASLTKSAAFATATLNGLFDTGLDVPPIEFPPENTRNAYWNGSTIFVPADVKDIPDIVYHEAAWPFVQQAWSDLSYSGETGALAQSYTDVLASVVKQAKLQQTANTADWVIGEGAIAWLTGRPEDILKDKRPLRSLKAPGEAYDDPVLGADRQVSNFKNIGPKELFDIHASAGIPNKAFYETAIRIGTEPAAEIWIESLSMFDHNTDLRQAGVIIYQAAKNKFGEGSDQSVAVKTAWEFVGLEF